MYWFISSVRHTSSSYLACNESPAVTVHSCLGTSCGCHHHRSNSWASSGRLRNFIGQRNVRHKFSPRRILCCTPNFEHPSSLGKNTKARSSRDVWRWPRHLALMRGTLFGREHMVGFTSTRRGDNIVLASLHMSQHAVGANKRLERAGAHSYGIPSGVVCAGRSTAGR
jgi:hypothetical protein